MTQIILIVIVAVLAGLMFGAIAVFLVLALAFIKLYKG